MWAVRGRIVALASDRNVAPSEDSVFAGRVWIGDDDRIVAVTKGTSAGPPGSDGATIIDVGSSLVIPGLVDLHNHLAYNTLPLWTEPSQITPFAHHNSWTRADTYALRTTWPAYALITACPQELLAYVEAKAVVGGTTSIQGSPPKNRPRDGWLVRNIEDETFGQGNANLVYASVLTAKSSALAERANKMRKGAAFIYHCAEGQPGSIVAREFTDAEKAGCLRVAVHRGTRQRRRSRRFRTLERSRRDRLVTVFQSVAVRAPPPTSRPPDVPGSRSAWARTGLRPAPSTCSASSRPPSSPPPTWAGTCPTWTWSRWPPATPATCCSAPGSARSAGCSPELRPIWW